MMKPKKEYREEQVMNITYTMQGDYLLTDLQMPEQPEVTLGKYARMRERYLKQHRRILYTNLLTTGKLTKHLAETEQTANERIERMIAQMAQTEGLTEQMKADDPMKWTGLMNNLRHAAEELILTELICS